MAKKNRLSPKKSETACVSILVPVVRIFVKTIFRQFKIP